ncbi:MAG: pyridoxamine 5'-phosphate oxidase family protein [Calditrichaeota bacterium]|nr:pyridoxamine 5'-phosphate oxidase family protein [Calditrichota bacterium]
MGQQFRALSPKHIAFIELQKIFFVGTAAESGTVNISPKGGDTLRVLSPEKIIWLNLTGSGNESAAHVLQNPRMTLMFCAFEGSPQILRTYGRATVVHQTDSNWPELADHFPRHTGARQLFVLDIDLVQTSCGMAVPLFGYQKDRDDLDRWAERKGAAGIADYWVKKNQSGIDGFETEIVQRNGVKA